MNIDADQKLSAGFSPHPEQHWAWPHWPEPAASAEGFLTESSELPPAGQSTTTQPASTEPPASGPSHPGTPLPEWLGALRKEQKEQREWRQQQYFSLSHLTEETKRQGVQGTEYPDKTTFWWLCQKKHNT